MSGARIEPIVTIHLVDAGATMHGVIVITAKHDIWTIPSADRVVSHSGMHKIGACFAVQVVLPASAEQPIRIGAARKDVVSIAKTASYEREAGLINE